MSKKNRNRGSLLDRHGNLTGGQVATICDSLLYSALEPLYLRTRALHYLPATLLNLTQVYPRRKLSTQDNPRFMASLMRCLTQDVKEQWHSLKLMGIERFVWLKAALEFVGTTAEPYLAAYHRAMSDGNASDLQYVREMEALHGRDLYPVCKHVTAGIQMFLKFRDAVAEQFYALAVQTATSIYQRRTKPIVLKDLIQLLMIAIAKTLDRYTSEKGALTSYFKLWMKSSASQSSIIEGQAYDVPASVRQKQATGSSLHQNFGVSLDRSVGEDGESTLGELIESSAPTPEEWVEQRSAEARMLKLIKLADHHRTFRALNQITETFSDQELVLLSMCAVKK